MLKLLIAYYNIIMVNFNICPVVSYAYSFNLVGNC